MLGKIVLGVTAAALISYGLICFFIPDIPAGYIGYLLTNADARIELIAMYGGLEIGLGLLCVVGLLKSRYEKPALLSISLLLGGLFLARVISLLLVDGAVTEYTYGAIGLEGVTSLLAAIAFAKTE